ncbi:Alpha-L-fucosidase [Bertholletia excelsa]
MAWHNTMKASNLVIWLSVVLSVATIGARKDCKFPAIFNFGDSNSDTGALAAVFLSLPMPPPYGETFFGMPSGRFSDGRLIIDFMAKSLGMPFLSPYLDSVGANYSKGVNFAVGESTIRPFRSLGFGPGPFYLDIQFSQFLIFRNNSKIVRKQGGVFANLLPEEEVYSKALYTIEIGQNDISYRIATKMMPEKINSTVPRMIRNVTWHVESLYNVGARSFWIHNTGPIGCLANVLTNIPISPDQIDEAGCAKNFNSVAQYFNYKLKQAVSFFSNPQKYGFVEPLVVCCGLGGKYNYNSLKACGIFATSCSNPSVKVIWDGGHYTDAANKIVFDKISTGAFSDPPIPPEFACHKSSY